MLPRPLLSTLPSFDRTIPPTEFEHKNACLLFLKKMPVPREIFNSHRGFRQSLLVMTKTLAHSGYLGGRELLSSWSIKLQTACNLCRKTPNRTTKWIPGAQIKLVCVQSQSDIDLNNFEGEMKIKWKKIGDNSRGHLVVVTQQWNGCVMGNSSALERRPASLCEHRTMLCMCVCVCVHVCVCIRVGGSTYECEHLHTCI